MRSAIRESGSESIFTAGEQQSHPSKGLLNWPTRGQPCRQLVKASRPATDGGGYAAGARAAGQMFPGVREQLTARLTEQYK